MRYRVNGAMCASCGKSPRHKTKLGRTMSYCSQCQSLKASAYLLKRFGTSLQRHTPYGDRIRKNDKEYQRIKRSENPGYKAKEYSEYRKKYPEKVKAQQTLNRAVKAGKIKKQPCYKCKETYRIQAHHPDYSKPLDVIWVCTLHHKPLHAA